MGFQESPSRLNVRYFIYIYGITQAFQQALDKVGFSNLKKDEIQKEKGGEKKELLYEFHSLKHVRLFSPLFSMVNDA